ncbi:hypothetical protein LTR10_018183 [Elasticomyces elasticus]|uniref:Peptidase C45 hydrolase domain-containing protein n=1 Tax=Exophiala sideris TaxID=1016849 RepID=A0ABR0J2M4_9EURO|nr:hypothetical protein LTR10_018183 [Elasticomyces elasticus]KAK5024936.1 hypothetical protein LTS07_008314 [Exophiala sideris]KAK5031475.1 hypothetical protein LTR13_007803 [Exophiala sideris]KAK5054975.1 hypothetical protein LTR69_008543 [Exophiala sideris]KAK5179855.1 hypothetical protein LTR44_007671 [Eurotiomycetes sp. CCFEE 6388]
MLEVRCEGSPRQIGIQHGGAAAKQIRGSVTFYADLFKKYTGRSWANVLVTAEQFATNIQQTWPNYFEEIEGIAHGSGRDLLDIVALNVRTEIAFGQLSKSNRSDGCTTVSWGHHGQYFLGQNWDWMEEQKQNLLLLTIVSDDSPTKKMVTEAGIIGKIGLNSAGVGVCLNAIRARGYSDTRLPVHLALRAALDATSAAGAAKTLEETGVGGAAHILVADCHEMISLEFTFESCIRLVPDEKGMILHTNHMLGKHRSIDESPEEDSFARMVRMKALTDKVLSGVGKVSLHEFARLFDDHDGFPQSICRSQQEPSEDATVFNIVMNLQSKSAVVRLGRPCCVDTEYTLSFEDY